MCGEVRVRRNLIMEEEVKEDEGMVEGKVEVEGCRMFHETVCSPGQRSVAP